MSRKSCGHIHGETASIDSRRRTLMSLVGASLAGAGLAMPRSADAKGVLMAHLPEDEKFMRLALAEAARGDFPFGTVIVQDGKVLATGHNKGVTTDDPTAHGEMVAIHTFLAGHPAALLRGTTLYTSGEPCPMCMGAIVWCGIGRVVFAASIAELSARMGQIMVTSRVIADAAPFATISITGGVLAKEALALFEK
jgi:tRNA(adenine34) deaminase